MSHINAGADNRHRLVLSVPAGLLAVAGSGSLAVGAHRPLVAGGATLRSASSWPSIWVVLGLAGVTALAGVVAFLGGRSALARTAVGALVIPALANAGLVGGWMQAHHGDTVRTGGVRALALGGLLVVLGVVLLAAAALLGLIQLATGGTTRAGRMAALLGLLAAGGTAQLWFLGGLTWSGASLMSSSDLIEVTARDDVGWSGLTVVGSVIAITVTLGHAAARRSAVAAGVALGAAALAGVELAVRMLVGAPAAAQLAEAPATAVTLRPGALVATGATALLGLLLAMLLRGTSDTASEESDYANWESSDRDLDDDAAAPASTDWDADRQWAYQPD
ncbi:MAG: hypothetical protein HYR62_01080 [Actinobacteria bacterium]|nr:hypothetical protein [Actinomycetota bacterium]MBI3686653.1 hypothetical protein [Actinomycetota bacterium]